MLKNQEVEHAGFEPRMCGKQVGALTTQPWNITCQNWTTSGMWRETGILAQTKSKRNMGGCSSPGLGIEGPLQIPWPNE